MPRTIPCEVLSCTWSASGSGKEVSKKLAKHHYERHLSQGIVRDDKDGPEDQKSKSKAKADVEDKENSNVIGLCIRKGGPLGLLSCCICKEETVTTTQMKRHILRDHGKMKVSIKLPQQVENSCQPTFSPPPTSHQSPVPVPFSQTQPSPFSPQASSPHLLFSPALEKDKSLFTPTATPSPSPSPSPSRPQPAPLQSPLALMQLPLSSLQSSPTGKNVQGRKRQRYHPYSRQPRQSPPLALEKPLQVISDVTLANSNSKGKITGAKKKKYAFCFCIGIYWL